MTYRGEIGDVVTRTCKYAGVVSLEWRIPKFLSLDCKSVDHYNCRPFLACGGKWCFKLYPDGSTQGAPTGRCDLFLFRLDKGANETFSVVAGIRGAAGAVKNKKKVTQAFPPDNRACVWFEFCWKSSLGARLMNGDALVITLDMKTEVLEDAFTQTAEKDGEDKVCAERKQSTEKQDAFTQTVEATREDGVPTEENQSSEKKGIQRVMEDIGKLLASGENSDVTVQVGDVEFQAHRAILSARCPVLSSMFRHETAEKATGKITIRDCEPEAFGDFLHYLYQGSARRLSEKNVFDLYRIADRYLADDLKQQCLEHVQGTLSVQTFCATVRLALTHAQWDLLEQAVEFFTGNMRSIIRSVEWQVFNCDHPTEANEILIKALGPEN